MVFLLLANEVWGNLIFSEACVKNSVHKAGLPQCMLGYHSPEQATPGTRHPSRSRHPPRTWNPPEQALPGPGTPRAGTTPGTMHLPPAPPLGAEHAGRYGQRAGGTHPTGMQSCLIMNEKDVDYCVSIVV